jgi:hypothetical protein
MDRPRVAVHGWTQRQRSLLSEGQRRADQISKRISTFKALAAYLLVIDFCVGYEDRVRVITINSYG